MMKTRIFMLSAIVLGAPTRAEVVVEVDFNDGTLAPMVEANYGEGEVAVEVVEGAGVDGTPCARIANLAPNALGAAKYDMRFERGHVYTITFMARAEEGTAEVTAYLDAGDWKLKYPGGYSPAVEVGEEWQEITWTNVQQQGRSYLANVRNNSQTPVLVDDVVIRESEAPVAINHALAENGGEPSADSLYAQYRLEPINDGLQMHVGSDFTRRATVTEESAEPHWVQVSFPGERPLSRVVVYWAIEDGSVYSSRQFEVQLLVDDAWQTVAEIEETEAATVSRVDFDEAQATAVRVMQPPGGGSAERPNLMWVTEVEAY
ncbi:MAG: discoidin domain-containing protein [Armatimonadota bacterium]